MGESYRKIDASCGNQHLLHGLINSFYSLEMATTDGLGISPNRSSPHVATMSYLYPRGSTNWS